MVTGAGLGFVSQILAARWLGAAEYGEYRYALAWAAILAVFPTLGLDSALLRFVPEHLAKKEWSLAKGVMIRAWQVTGGVGSLLALLGSGAVILLDLRFTVPYSEVLVLGMWLIPFQSAMRLQTGMGRALGAVTVAYFPNSIAKPLLFVGGLFLAGLWFGHLNGRLAVGVTIAVAGALAIMQGFLLWYRLSPRVRRTRPAYATRRWLRVSLPLLLIAAFLLILNRTDILMLGALVGTREVGIYHAAAKTAELVSFLLIAVNALAAPTIAELYTERRYRELQATATAVAQYAFWPSLVIGTGLVLTAPVVLGLFGPEFVQGRGVLVVLVVGQVVNAGVGSVAYFLNLTGYQDDSARVFGTVAFVNVLLNGVAIPVFGALGAAAATAISMVTWNLWMHWLVVRRLGIHTSVLSVLSRK